MRVELPDYPKLRWPLDLRIERFDGQEALIIQCPLGISEKPLLLVRAVAPLVTALDGSQSLAGLVTKFSSQFHSQSASEKLIRELVTLLDAHLFLEGPRFWEAEKNIKQTFRESQTRSAALAGLSYPATQDDLSKLVSGILCEAGAREAPTDKSLACLMAPHIDYRRGHASYGESYRCLAGDKSDLYILMGTSHQYSPRLFHLTAKDFQTPLGVLKCDTEFVTKLASRHGLSRSFEDELLHRREHSLELQTPFVRYVRDDAKIVPILVGSFHDGVVSGKFPSEKEEYESFIGALTEQVRDAIIQGTRVCIIAGVDMAHVGPQFGDPSLTPEMMEEVRQRDLQYLAHVSSRDKKALFAHIAEDNDKRRICGFPTMYTILDLFDRLNSPVEGYTLGYHQAVDYSAGCAVTFGGMTFRG